MDNLPLIIFDKKNRCPVIQRPICFHAICGGILLTLASGPKSEKISTEVALRFVRRICQL